MSLSENFIYSMCCVGALFAVADMAENLNPGFTGNAGSTINYINEIRIKNRVALPYNRHCYAGDNKDISLSKTDNTWMEHVYANKLQESQNAAFIKQATNLKENGGNQIRIIQHLASNPYSTMNQNSELANLKIDESTWDHANSRSKRMNNEENKEREDEQLRANIEEVFKSRSLESNKLTDNNLIYEQTDDIRNNPELNKNIEDVFGFANSARLLAPNVQNVDTHNNLKELTNHEDTGESIDDVDGTTKKTNLNAMILEQFGPEIVDDEQETTTEYRFTDKTTLLSKYNNMAKNHHQSTNTSSSGADSNQSASILCIVAQAAVILLNALV